MNTFPMYSPSLWSEIDEISQLTSSKSPARFDPTAWLTASPDAGKFDVMCRFNKTTSSTKVTMWDTAQMTELLAAGFSRLESSVHTLRSVVHWQKHRLDYDSVHSAYLLGAISEDEFLSEADRFVREPETMSPGAIAQSIAQVELALQDSLSASDYADFLGVDVEEVLTAVPRLAGQEDDTVDPTHLASEL